MFADLLGHQLVHGGAHLDVGGGLFDGESGEEVHLRVVPAGSHDGGGIPQAFEDEKLVLDGFKGAEGLHQIETIGSVGGTPVVRVDAIAHEHRGEAAWGSGSGCGSGFTLDGAAPGVDRFKPREAEGDACATKEMSAGEAAGAGTGA